jgi:hypothetical protein
MRRRLPLLGLSALFVALALAGCDGSGEPTASTGPTAPDERKASPVPTDPLSTRISLSTTSIASGERLAGVLTVTNRTDEPITLTLGGGCRPKWAVVLANEQIRTEPVFTLECATQPMVIAPGRSDLPFTVTSTFGACTPDASRATSQVPLCRPDGAMPPLPPGEYDAVLVSQSPDLPAPPPIVVRIRPA